MAACVVLNISVNAAETAAYPVGFVFRHSISGKSCFWHNSPACKAVDQPPTRMGNPRRALPCLMTTPGFFQGRSSRMHFRRDVSLSLASRRKEPANNKGGKKNNKAPIPAIIEDTEERNVMIAEAYSSIVTEFTEKKMPIVEVALDVPERWWNEVVMPRLDRIAEGGNLAPGKRVLDVGTGVGTMVGLVSKPGRAHAHDVVGLDLCQEMLEVAQDQHPDATFVLGDIMDFELRDLLSEDDEPGSPVPPKFDAIFFNAVFGNLANQLAALDKAASLCKTGGRVIVSHPMGAEFVASLVKEDNYFTPNPLPTSESLGQMLRFLPLSVHGQVVDEEEFYLAVMVRWGPFCYFSCDDMCALVGIHHNVWVHMLKNPCETERGCMQV
jgi:SAM-dependent methyltransferase